MFWYTLIVVPTQTFLAILMAVLLNAPMRMKQFFRTIFYAPSVTSSVVITLIFVWFYLKSGYVNYFLQSMFGVVGIQFAPVNWLGDPRGLIQLIVGAFWRKYPFQLNGTCAGRASPGWPSWSKTSSPPFRPS